MGHEFAAMIDHTLLKAVASEAEIRTLCAEAREFGFISVCVNPSYVPLCIRELSGSSVLVCTVVGFPLGASTSASKVGETLEAVASGAREIDMVLSLGALKSGRPARVADDIAAVVKAAGEAKVKVILETCYLTRDEIVMACRLSESAGAAFVKTSTGFGSGGATLEDVALMAASISPKVSVKASGGIRDLASMRAMILAGATRIGTSSGPKIMAELAETRGIHGS